MASTFVKFSFLSLLIFSTSAICIGQSRTKEPTATLFAELADDEKAVAACEKIVREEQIKKFGKVLPRVSGNCFSGCPVRVVMPLYPEIARRLNISGDVSVDTIVDEKGNVVFAKIAKGRGFFRQVALDAAYQSKYQPKITCNNRPIKFRWLIKYHFTPSM